MFDLLEFIIWNIEDLHHQVAKIQGSENLNESKTSWSKFQRSICNIIISGKVKLNYCKVYDSTEKA